MCLAVPMKVVSVEGTMGTVEAFGIRKQADLGLVQPVEEGSYVLIHAGFALQVVDEESALQTLEYFKEMGRLQEEEWENEGLSGDPADPEDPRPRFFSPSDAADGETKDSDERGAAP